MTENFQPIDVLTLLQEFVLQKHLSKPDHAETIKPWSVNWTLLGRVLQAKKA